MKTVDIFSDIKIHPMGNKNNANSKVLAYGQVTVGNLVVVKFSVFSSKNGPWAKLPATRSNKIGENGFPIEYPDVKFLDKDVYQTFQSVIRDKYNSIISENQGSSGSGEESQANELDDNVPF